MNIGCLIVEDEPLATCILEQYIEQTPFLQMAAAIEYVQDTADIVCRQRPDIVFLNVNTKCSN